jgi:hypothetical protein
MKVELLRESAIADLDFDKKKIVISKIKTFEKRISAMEKALKELRFKYDEFLESDVEDMEFDEFDY